jgi:lysophospholipase L1-like esterase
MESIKNAYRWHRQYSDACVQIASIAAVPLVDIRTALENCARDIFFSDGMHPNDEGHSVICETMYEALKQKREVGSSV